MSKGARHGVLLVVLTLGLAAQVAGVDAQPRDHVGPGPGPMCTTTVAQGMMGPGMMQSPAPPAPGAGGAAIFRSQCAPCHSLQAGSSGLPGPNLHAVFGRKAGTTPGFSFSAAMRDSGVVWNDRTLDQFIAAPQTYISGDAMPFPGLADKTARQRLIGYLKAATR